MKRTASRPIRIWVTLLVLLNVSVLAAGFFATTL